MILQYNIDTETDFYRPEIEALSGLLEATRKTFTTNEGDSMKTIDILEVKEYLAYDKDSGLFTWIKRPKQARVSVGDIAGTLCHGYIQITLRGVRFLAHRLAFEYIHGRKPFDQIDHINGKRHDNSIHNIREVGNTENSKNKTLPSNNSSGVIGVCWSKPKRKWRAEIQIDYKNIYLGAYLKFSDAVDARKNAEILYGFHENHGKKGKIYG